MNDLVFAGGRVLDPARGLDAAMDLAISGGVVSALGAGASGTEPRGPSTPAA